MKAFILSLFITVLSFAQIDSMGITWQDPTSSDLDSIQVFADTSATPTTYRGSVAENIEAFNWQPPYTGLWRVGLKSIDDSSNVSSLSPIDTVTIWGSSASLVTSSLAAHWDYTDLANGSVASWADQIDALTLAQATGTMQPTKSASGVTFDGGDALVVANDITFSDAVSIEVVVNIADTTLAGYQCVIGGRNTNGILYIGFLANGQLCVSAWDGTTVYEFAGNTTGGYSTVNHIVATFTGNSVPTVYVNGVVVPDIADASNFGDNNRVAMGGVDGENSFIAANSIIFAGSIYTKVLSQEEAEQNYSYYQGEGYIP